MLADVDLVLIAVFCTADDLLPERAKNAKRSVTDAEVVTLCVPRAVMDIASDRVSGRRAQAARAPGVSWQDVASSLRLSQDAAPKAYGPRD